MKKRIAKKNATATTKTVTRDCACAQHPDRRSYALVFVRLVLAGLFLLKGVTKLLDPVATSTQFAAWGFWSWLGPIVGALEFVVGALILIGFWTRWSALGAAAILVVAIVTVHSSQLFSVKFPFLQVLALAALLVLATSGPGRWALDHECNCCPC